MFFDFFSLGYINLNLPMLPNAKRIHSQQSPVKIIFLHISSEQLFEIVWLLQQFTETNVELQAEFNL